MKVKVVTRTTINHNIIGAEEGSTRTWHEIVCDGGQYDGEHITACRDKAKAENIAKHMNNGHDSIAARYLADHPSYDMSKPATDAQKKYITSLLRTAVDTSNLGAVSIPPLSIMNASTASWYIDQLKIYQD